MTYLPIVTPFERGEALPPTVDPRCPFDALALTLFAVVPDLVRFRIAYDVRTCAADVVTPGYVIADDVERHLRNCIPCWVKLTFSSRIVDEVAL